MTARRTIDEVLIRYELEPKLRDVYVEGKFDKEILSNCFRASFHHDRIVYEIDSVDIPIELLISHNLTEGNKQRVIALARELANQTEGASYLCLVDKDLDHWFGPLESTDRLIWTDFCSIELYFFSDEILRDILLITANSKIKNWEEYINSIIVMLRDLYALRLADRELNLSLDWLAADKCLSHKNDRVIFDLSEYTSRLLNKNGKTGCRVQFDYSLAIWQTKLLGDHRFYIRGHDFVELLAWTIKEFKGIKEFSTALCVQRLFVLLSPKIPGILNSL